MKRKVVKILCAAAFALTAGMASAAPFTLKGTVNGLEGKYIYFSYREDGTDSAKVVNGAFEFKGQLDYPATEASLYVKGETNVYDPKKVYSFFLEPKAQTVAVDAADFSKSRLSGSATQLQTEKLMAEQARIMAEAQPILDSIKVEKDREKATALRDKLDPYYKRVNAAYMRFVEQHPSSYAAPNYLMLLMGNLPYEKINALYAAFPADVKKMRASKEIADELAILGKVRPGKPAPDFTTKDVNGKPFTLSSLRGKYVLLDFWASWCVPCRKGNPHMKELYKKYHDKGLEVVCVSDDDSKPEAWRAAIAKDGIGMFHHVLRGMKILDRKKFTLDKTNDISDKYAIHYLPTKYLIDKEGKIIGKVSEEDIDARLKQVFGF